MPRKPRATAVVFPFDAFGGGGTAAGATLLGDVLREVIDDTKCERTPVRQHAFADSLSVVEAEFNTLETLNGWQVLGKTLFEKHRGDFLVWLAGNHLGTLPVYDVLPRETVVLQFDAHLDCYDLHDTHTTLSHGNFLKHVAKPAPRIVNVGHRDLFLPASRVAKVFADVVGMDLKLPKLVTDAGSVWIDIDADVFDPSVCPAVRQPQPCGLSGRDLLAVLMQLDFSKVAGVSVSEFDPALDVRDASLNLLGWLLEWLLLRKFEV